MVATANVPAADQLIADLKATYAAESEFFARLIHERC